MNLEELKTAWQVYNKKIQAVETINERLIESIIKERSVSRISAIKRQYNGYFILLVAELIALTALLLGNPFDFKYKLQFVPYVIITIGVLVAFFNLLKIYLKLNAPSSAHSIGTFLKNILQMYEQNKVFEKWFGAMFLSAGFVIPLSFLPQKIERSGLTNAMIETGAMMAGTLVFYFLAAKAGFFKDRNKENLAKDLAELNELKAMSQELTEK
jgi:hypothetical protein